MIIVWEPLLYGNRPYSITRHSLDHLSLPGLPKKSSNKKKTNWSLPTQVLRAAHNDLSSLSHLGTVLSRLAHLKHLHLIGNPVTAHRRYRPAAILAASPTLGEQRGWCINWVLVMEACTGVRLGSGCCINWVWLMETCTAAALPGKWMLWWINEKKSEASERNTKKNVIE